MYLLLRSGFRLPTLPHRPGASCTKTCVDFLLKHSIRSNQKCALWHAVLRYKQQSKRSGWESVSEAFNAVGSEKRTQAEVKKKILR